MNYNKAITRYLLFIILSLSVFIPAISSAEPLDNWHIRNSPINSTLRSVTYGNGIFVAVGDNGTILSSTDGVVWTSRSSGTTAWLNGVTYGNGIFVVVGSHETILTSSDGINWTIRRSGAEAGLNSVTYGNGMFIAVGSSETILSSTDAINWTLRHSGSYSLNGVAYGNSQFIALYRFGLLYISSDGINWSTQKIEDYEDYIFFDITFGKGAFVIVGGLDYSGGTATGGYAEIIITSFDGVNWMQTYSGTFNELYGSTYGNGNFITVGLNGTILSSPGGSHWVSRQSWTTQWLYGATYGNSTFVAVGNTGTILQSDPMVANTNCTAIFSSDLSLHVPIIDFSGSYLWADLQYEAGTTNDIMLKVTYYDFVYDPMAFSNCQASILSYDATYKLHIPSISFNNLFYRADLEYMPTSDGQIWFKLTGGARN